MVNEIQLKEKAISGKPNRLLTLTLKPRPGESFFDAYARGKPAISRLWHRIRAKYLYFEAMTFLEQHRSGFPHWHSLVRSNWLSQRYISDQWRALTGSFIVDIRQIRNPKVAAGYVTKYVTKQLDKLRAQGIKRVWSRTRGYLMEDKSNPPQPGWHWQYSREHPSFVAEVCYSGWLATPLGEGHYDGLQLTPDPARPPRPPQPPPGVVEDERRRRLDEAAIAASVDPGRPPSAASRPGRA